MVIDLECWSRGLREGGMYEECVVSLRGCIEEAANITPRRRLWDEILNEFKFVVWMMSATYYVGCG